MAIAQPKSEGPKTIVLAGNIQSYRRTATAAAWVSEIPWAESLLRSSYLLSRDTSIRPVICARGPFCCKLYEDA